ncbi:uncharacterized protein [Apostichopus japonicus]|uniref:uncharacterized protein n=1 Tax=Stichopus japonicus TaxID=307972 RepID=UPI003AB44111
MNDLNSLISDEEYLPLPKQLQPTPVSQWTNLTPSDIGDPALKLTPDKSSRFEQYCQGDTVPKSKKCDKFIDGREEERGITRRQTTFTTVQKEDDTKTHKVSAWVEKHGTITRTVYNAELGTQGTKEGETKSGNQGIPKCKREKWRKSTEPAEVSVNAEKLMGHKQKNFGSKETTNLKPILHKKGDGESKNKRSSIKKHVRLADSPGLDKPILNSTSLLAAELHKLEKDTFDSKRAVSKSLAESKEVRSTLSERAADGVNIPKHVKKYPGLISVEIPKEDVLDQAVEERLMRLTVSPDEERKDKDQLPSPDVLDAFTPDMIVEYANLDISSLTLPPPRLQQIPLDETFHLYQRISGWEK